MQKRAQRRLATSSGGTCARLYVGDLRWRITRKRRASTGSPRSPAAICAIESKKQRCSREDVACEGDAKRLGTRSGEAPLIRMPSGDSLNMEQMRWLNMAESTVFCDAALSNCACVSTRKFLFSHGCTGWSRKQNEAHLPRRSTGLSKLLDCAGMLNSTLSNLLS